MRRTKLIAFCLSLWGALALIHAGPSYAQVSAVENYGNPVSSGASATYFDLLKKIFPDAEMDAAGSSEAVAHLSIPLDHLFGDYKNRVYRAQMKINAVESLFLQTGGRRRLLLLVHVESDGEQFTWGELGVLALFELEPTARLLDATDIKADRFSNIREEQPVLHISAQADAVMITNYHHNSSQGYLNLTLLGTEGDRLRTIFDFPTLLNLNYCGNNSTQTPTIRVLRASRGGHFNISVKIRLVKEADDESCEKITRGFTREFNSVLVWNSSKRKYESTGNALRRLAQLNERNF
ncbi:MAG TPA: hypothetical protein VIW80_23285 [Pyrinomonadaceae bacterium]